MRQQNQLLHARTRVRPRYAVMPVEGFPPSKLPNWSGAEVFVLAAPALGADFVEYLFVVEEGGGAQYFADNETQSFLYVLSGKAQFVLDGRAQDLSEGGFAYIPCDTNWAVEAQEPSRLLLLRKRYEACEGVDAPAAVVGNQSEVEGGIYMGIEGSRLQVLIPDEMPYDMAMNIFTFEPGYSLPVVETHVMEHGLYFLQGKGVYFLDGEWMEVEADDFIWMGPYCPQSFYATGPVASRYLYYKNVNRDISL